MDMAFILFCQRLLPELLERQAWRSNPYCQDELSTYQHVRTSSSCCCGNRSILVQSRSEWISSSTNHDDESIHDRPPIAFIGPLDAEQSSRGGQHPRNNTTQSDIHESARRLGMDGRNGRPDRDGGTSTLGRHVQCLRSSGTGLGGPTKEWRGPIQFGPRIASTIARDCPPKFRQVSHLLSQWTQCGRESPHGKQVWRSHGHALGLWTLGRCCGKLDSRIFQ